MLVKYINHPYETKVYKIIDTIKDSFTMVHIPYICFLQCSRTLESGQVTYAATRIGKDKYKSELVNMTPELGPLIECYLLQYLGWDLPLLKITNVI